MTQNTTGVVATKKPAGQKPAPKAPEAQVKKELKLVAAVNDLTISDLTYVDQGGRKFPLTVSKGDQLQLKFFKAEDVERSLAMGCLKNAIQSGWLIDVNKVTGLKSEVELPTTSVTKIKPEVTKSFEEAAQADADVIQRQIQATQKESIEKPGPSIRTEDVRLPKDTAAIVSSSVLLNPDQVKTFDDFLRMPDPYQEKFLEQSQMDQMELVREIGEKIGSPKIQALAKNAIERMVSSSQPSAT